MRSTIDRRTPEIKQVEELLNRLAGPEAVFFGLDVGRAVDHSALSALVRYVFPVDSQFNTLITKYYCVYLHRYDLKTPYEVIENDAVRWWNWADITGMKRYFIMDMTGVGAPVLEGIRRKRVRTIGVTLTGGMQETNPDIDQYNVPKPVLTTQLLRTAQMGRFKGYDTIPDWKELTEELGSFGYKINKDTANITYESLDDKVHDDLVISVALPIWYGERVVPFRTPLKSGGGSDLGDLDYNPLNPQG
jgi:hypothetical protein